MSASPGNYVCAVWFGNDDNSPTNTVTGGLLPTQAWRGIMDYAHKDIELKPIPGLAPREGEKTAQGAGAAGKAKPGAFTPVSLSSTQRRTHAFGQIRSHDYRD